MLGAALAGLAIGLRSQTAVLTAPLLAARRDAARLSGSARLAAVAPRRAGVALWAVPLIVRKRRARRLSRRARQPGRRGLLGVVMLWTNPTPRVAVFALSTRWCCRGTPAGSGACVVALRAGRRDPAACARSVSAVLRAARGIRPVCHLSPDVSGNADGSLCASARARGRVAGAVTWPRRRRLPRRRDGSAGGHGTLSRSAGWSWHSRARRIRLSARSRR